MTIAISLKVNDGVVLAADSATTLFADPSSAGVVQVFNNANKVFNLRKGLPIGLITWGAGSIGRAGISTLVKDLRALYLTCDKSPSAPWYLNPNNYSVKKVAEQVRQFMFEENYLKVFAGAENSPPLGFVVAGYSSGPGMAEEYQITISEKGECPPPVELRKPEICGLTWNGEPEAISRLLLGFSPMLTGVMQERLNVPKETVPEVMEVIRGALETPVIYDAMPIQDAIDLAQFLVDLTARFSRFTPGAPTVGGPIEIAAITKHEGFKWIQRKLYFPDKLNPLP